MIVRHGVLKSEGFGRELTTHGSEVSYYFIICDTHRKAKSFRVKYIYVIK